jgi:hypothetical protein
VSERWQSYELQQVARVPALDRAMFVERFQGQRPLVVSGGAHDSPMLERWDLSYLSQVAGGATVNVAAYPEDRRDFERIEPREMSLAEFLADVARPARDEVRYLIPLDPSPVFARNDTIARLHVSWAAAVNPGLARLAADFRLPSFIAPEDYVLAVLIIGSRENATALHYDNGGEAKVLIQVRGRKRIILFPPHAAAALRPHTLFRRPGTPSGSGSRATVDIHALSDPSASADAPAGWVAEVGPGDLVYWPPFWFHDVENLDEVNIAVGVFLDEIRLPALLLRHAAHLIFREVLAEAEARARGQGAAGQDGSPRVRAGWGVELAVGDRPAASLGELFQELERTLLAPDASEVQGLWEWNDRLGRDR